MRRKKYRPELPVGCIHVKTYSDFEADVKSFATGEYPLLLIIGLPGTSKSQTVRRALGNVEHLYIETAASALGIYQLVYKHLHQPVVIDDLDTIYRDKDIVRLLKSLCNTDLVKHLRWATNHHSIGDGDDQTPAEYSTRSPVCLIANRWETLNENVLALEDRAIVLYFDPSAQEVHDKVGEWFDDREVYDFIGQNLLYIVRPSMRLYIKGSQLRKTGRSNWREYILRAGGATDKELALRDIWGDPRFQTEAERVAEFVARGLGTRSTYFEWKRRMLRSA